MKRDVYPVKVIKILPVPPDGPKPPFLKSPKRLAALYTTVCAAAMRMWLSMWVGAGRWAARGRNAGGRARLAAAARYRATLARIKERRPLGSFREALQRGQRSESSGTKAVGRAKSRMHTMRTRELWPATQTAMALQVRTWREALRQRMFGLKNHIADQLRLLTHRRVNNEKDIASTESHDPSRPGPSDRLEPANGLPQRQQAELETELAAMAADLIAIKTDLANHQKVIDDLTKKLAAVQGRGAPRPSPALGSAATPPTPKPPLPTKRNGQGEAKFHRS